MTRGTLTQLFFTTTDRHAGLPAAFRSKVGGTWKAITHRETLERVQAISLGLRELRIAPGDKVAIVSENRPEWALADYACLCARATDVPIYPTLPANQTKYILNDSEAVAVFCSTTAQIDKVLEVKAGLPRLKHVIAFDGAAAAQHAGVMALAEVEAKGRAAKAKYPDWKREAVSVAPEDLATLIYTSGTTGDPKGVMLSHYNIWSNVQACLQIIPIGGGDECLSMLPLSHSYERMVDYTLFQAGVIINFPESFDTVAANLQEVKPTVVLSVPRLYEKGYARVLENALSGSAIKRSIFFWAKRAGEQWATLALAGLPIPGGLAIRKKIADRLVFAKLQARTGGRIRFFVSGAAPLSADIAKFFYSAGLPIIEGYGLTESSPVLTLNPLDGIVKRNKSVATAVLYGDRRKFPIILVVPNFDNLEHWAAERALSYGTRAELLELADVQAKMEREVMGTLRDLAKFETPKKVLLLENDFTIESGELTPTLKVKRRVIEKRYKDQIDAAYASADALTASIESPIA